MESENNYDELIYPILCSEGNIIGFFDKIFDFLYRRTDYFKVKSDDCSELGLAPGEAEEIVKSAFCKYMKKSVSESTTPLNFQNDLDFPEYISEETIVTSSTEEAPINTDETSGNFNTTDDSSNESSKEDGKTIEAKIPLMDPDSYNGANYEDYSWAQTLQDVDIRIKVPTSVIAGKQVQVNIEQTHLKVEVFINNEWTTLKNQSLSWKINVEQSTWTLVPREHIHVCLQKMQERWWDSIFIGDPKIDLKSIDPSIAYEELDQDQQAKINELMYNQHLKRLGKPTIEQTKVQNILKEAWDCEGSPFKGQPFDPTLIDVQNPDAVTRS